MPFRPWCKPHVGRSMIIRRWTGGTCDGSKPMKIMRKPCKMGNQKESWIEMNPVLCLVLGPFGNPSFLLGQLVLFRLLHRLSFLLLLPNIDVQALLDAMLVHVGHLGVLGVLCTDLVIWWVHLILRWKINSCHGNSKEIIRCTFLACMPNRMQEVFNDYRACSTEFWTETPQSTGKTLERRSCQRHPWQRKRMRGIERLLEWEKAALDEAAAASASAAFLAAAFSFLAFLFLAWGMKQRQTAVRPILWFFGIAGHRLDRGSVLEDVHKRYKQWCCRIYTKKCKNISIYIYTYKYIWIFTCIWICMYLNKQTNR